MATGTRPDLSNIHEWGCCVWVKCTHSPKLSSKVQIGRFIGFDEESKGYCIYWEDRHAVTVKRDVYFDKRSLSTPEMTLIEGETHSTNQYLPKAVTPPENVELCTNEDADGQTVNATRKSTENALNRAHIEENPSRNGRDMTESNIPSSNTPTQTPIQNLEASQPTRPSEDKEEVENELLGRGRRPRQPTGFYKDLLSGKVRRGGKAATAAEETCHLLLSEDEIDEEDLLFAGIMAEYSLTSLGTGGEPQTLKEALNHTDEAPKWRAAVQAELDQIEKLGTWEIMEAPTDANIVSSKYVFRYKRDEHGHIAKYKARLVARGFTQKFGIDYFDTRVWIVRWETIRNLLAQAAARGSVIHQADVKNAYLNAEIKEDIYVELPPSYTDFRPLPPHLTGKRAVCKLKKGLYGTKQAGRGWYMKLRDTFFSLGYKVSNSDLGVFYKFSKEKYTIIAVATDDLTIIAESTQSAQLIKDQLNQHFEIVDLGEIK